MSPTAFPFMLALNNNNNKHLFRTTISNIRRRATTTAPSDQNATVFRLFTAMTTGRYSSIVSGSNGNIMTPFNLFPASFDKTESNHTFTAPILWNNHASNPHPKNTTSLMYHQQQSTKPFTTTTKKPKTKNTKPKKVTTLSLTSKKRHGHKITMVTAYDYPSALHVDRAGIDIILVGDSCAMVELGFETTQPITLDEMIHHCKAVKRGAPNRPLLVGDMPFGSYEFEDVDVALRNAYKMLKDGGMDGVKVEGGSEARAKTVRKLVEGGVAVMGHVGLTPQAISVIGGFRAQGRTATRARSLLDEAMRLQDAGAFAIVLECVPANVAKVITDTLEVPTIGIGAGSGTSGQVLVFHDMLGMLSHPHHEEFVPKFCKRYARVGHYITKGLEEFRQDVEEGNFPSDEYSPYVMTEGEKEAFDLLLAKDEEERKLKHDETMRKLTEADEYEQLSLYGNKDD